VSGDERRTSRGGKGERKEEEGGGEDLRVPRERKRKGRERK
jgi:hypothetical protein